MKDFKDTFANKTSTCLFFISACYNYIMAIIETMLLIFVAYHVASAAGFLAFTSNISIFAGIISMVLSGLTPYIKGKLSNNSLFGYITPIVFIICSTLFFACVFTGNGLYACYVGVALLATVRPLRYTLYNSFMNSTWAASGDEIKNLQGFSSTFSARPAKWLAALIMMVFAVTATISGNMLILAASIAVSAVVWLMAVYYTPKNRFKDNRRKPKKLKQQKQYFEFCGWKIDYKYIYWSVIATLAIISSTFLHILKDIINAKLIGVALLPAIRFWIALPIVTVFYAAGSVIKNCYLENNAYFGVSLVLFGAIFIVFAVLFPYSAVLQSFAVPSFLPNTAALMLQNWFLISFSMFCEMWTPIITSTIVYPIQNEYFDEDEVFTIIPIITIFQSAGELIAGTAMKVMSAYHLPITTIITIVISLVIASIVIMTYLHNAMYSSGCIKPKYLFREKMTEIAALRHTCRNSLIGLFCFAAGVTAMSYGFTIGAGVLMTLAAAGFMSDQITKVREQYYNPPAAAGAAELKTEAGTLGKGVVDENGKSNYAMPTKAA